MRDPAGSAPTKSTVANIQTALGREHTVWPLLGTLRTNTCCRACAARPLGEAGGHLGGISREVRVSLERGPARGHLG